MQSQANASNNLGCIAAERGNAAEAWERYQEALNIFTALQHPRNIADVLNDMGQLLIDAGAYDAAKDALIQSAKIAERIGNVELTAYNYSALGRLSVTQGDFTSARDWFTRTLSMWEEQGDTENAAITRRTLEVVTAVINGGIIEEESP